MNIQSIKDKIEQFTPNYHIELARILFREYNVPYDENQNGIFINLSHLSIPLLERIEKFIQYVEHQELHLSKDETEKNGLKDIYFNHE